MWLGGCTVSDGTIGNVKRMVSDPQAPTAPLDEFRAAYADDDNWWWMIGSGHHQNLFEMAIERIEELEAKLTEARAMKGWGSPWRRKR